MVTQELMQTAMQERLLEISRLQVEQRARELPEERHAGRSRPRFFSLQLPSFVTRALRVAHAA